MKITKNTIKKLIKEELKSLLDEAAFADAGKEIGDWASGRNPGLTDPLSIPRKALKTAAAPRVKANDMQAGQSLNMINQKLDQILHILNMTK
jgi:hypothetical protein